MSDVVQVALIAAIPGIGAVILGWRNQRTLAAGDKKLDVIHEVTNSNLTKALARIDGLESLIVKLTGKEAPK